jgi:hypothetical protein
MGWNGARQSKKAIAMSDNTNDDDDKKQLPAMPGNKNPFEQYADDVDKQHVIGSLLKFVKGDWLVGRDGEECTEKELVAIMPGFVHGWILWQDNRPIEHRMGLATESFVPADRDTLGHDDEALWELDAKGKPRDPWQPSLYLPMATVDGKTIYTFATSSDGGRRRGVAPLSRDYGQHIRQHPDELPVVGLEQDSYPHPDRTVGRVKYPLFPVIRYVKAKPYLDAVAALTGRPVNLLPGTTT